MDIPSQHTTCTVVDKGVNTSLYQRKNEKCYMRQSLKHYIGLMKIACLYYEKPMPIQICGKHYTSKLMCMFVCSLLWIRFLVGFFSYHSKLSVDHFLLLLSQQGYYMQISLISTTFILIITRRLPDLIQRWDNYHREFGLNLIHMITKYSNTTTFIICIAAIAFVSLAPLYVIKTSEGHYLNIYLYPLYQNTEIPLFMQSLLVIYYSYCLATSVIAIGLLVLLCLLLMYEFNEVVVSLKMYFKLKKYEDEPDMLEVLRRRHNSLCTLFLKLDQSFRWYIILAYAELAYVPVLTFCSSYNTTTIDKVGVSTIFFTFGTIVFRVLAMTIAASLASYQAKLPKRYLYQLPIFDGHAALHQTLQLFMERLNDHIGLTWGNIFNLEKGLVFKVITVTLSYIVVTIKFGQIFNSNNTDCATAYAHDNVSSLEYIYGFNTTSVSDYVLGQL